jgi:hypothetical protein
LKHLCSYFEVIFLHAVKSNDMDLMALLPFWRKLVLWIFIALKSPSPQLGLNPWTSGPVATALTITLLRQPAVMLLDGIFITCSVCHHRECCSFVVWCKWMNQSKK